MIKIQAAIAMLVSAVGIKLNRLLLVFIGREFSRDFSFTSRFGLLLFIQTNFTRFSSFSKELTMFSLQDLLGQEGGEQALSQISQSVGADHSTVNSAVQMALPMIMGALSQNAQQPQGAESLSNALQTSHDGSILDNIGSIVASAQQADGGGILGHIF